MLPQIKERQRLPALIGWIVHGFEEVSIQQSPRNIKDVICRNCSWHVQWQGCHEVLEDVWAVL